MTAGFDINSTSKLPLADMLAMIAATPYQTTTSVMSPVELYVLLNRTDDARKVTATVTRAGMDRFSLLPSFEHHNWLAEASEHLSKFRSVSDGWDGASAIAPSCGSLDAAEKLAVLLSSVPSSVRPELSFDALGRPTFARNNSVLYLHLTVDSANSLTWYAEVHGEERFEDEVTFNGRALPAKLQSVFLDAEKEKKTA